MRFWVVVLSVCLSSVVLAQAEPPTETGDTAQKVSRIPDNPFDEPPSNPFSMFQVQEVLKATCDKKLCIKPKEGVSLTSPMQTYGYSTTMVEYATTEFLYGGPDRCEEQHSTAFSNLESFAKHYRPDDAIGACGVNVYQEVYQNDNRKTRLVFAMSCTTDKGTMQVVLSMPEKEKETTLGLLSIKESGKKACRYRAIVAEHPTDEDTWYSWDHLDSHGADPLTHVEGL